jgi:hypothetical protein
MVWILILLAAVALTAVVSYYGQRRVMRRGARSTDTGGETATPQPTPDTLPEHPTVKFLLYQDNGGGDYWTIVDDGDEVIARSAGFASYPEANYTADIVHRAAASATFENRSGTTPPPRPLASGDRAAQGGRAAQGDQGAQGDQRAQDDQGAPESSSDPGGSVSRETVTRRAKAAGAWPAGSSSTPGGRRR